MRCVVPCDGWWAFVGEYRVRGACRIVRDKLRAGSCRTAEPPNRRVAELSSRLRYTVESRAWPSGPVIPDCLPIAISRHADRLAKDGPD
ncbi:hypothetical protein X947_4697 [Burkholderia pseudomallei MSHR7334]|nr:hypothetical protein X947_4697 [Burkholderia pseudomallei MSHR7334]